jgi:glycosyltransferase involved in cell wall biosynthesis
MSELTPHLLIVNHFALAPDMGGGTRHVELGRELVRRGWRVTIAATDFHVLERTYARRAGSKDTRTIEERVDGVRFRWLWSSAYERNDWRRVRNWLTFARSVTRSRWIEDRPDVVLGSSPQLFAAFAAWWLARALNVPFVLEVRDLWPESLSVGRQRRGIGYWALWLLARFLYRRATRIVVLARGVQAYLERLGIQPTRIVYVPNGADVAAFATSPRRGGEVMRLVYAGAHGPANGLDVVLAAARLLRDDPTIAFVFVGDGPAKESLVREAHQKDLSNVEFLDPVPKAAIPELLTSCDVGLMVLRDLPLFAFGVSPNKLFDYWSAGLPVICNVPGEVAAWVREARGGVQTADGTAESLVASIRELQLMGSQRRSALGTAGREWVRREHDRPVLAAKLDAVVRPLATSAAA